MGGEDQGTLCRPVGLEVGWKWGCRYRDVEEMEGFRTGNTRDKAF